MEKQQKDIVSIAQLTKWFGKRFDFAVKEFRGRQLGESIKVDLSNALVKGFWKQVDQLTIVTIRRDCKTFVGMSGSMHLIELPVSYLNQESKGS
jgi:hypothetical protein